jgi:Protein of unknown function (DUF3054)
VSTRERSFPWILLAGDVLLLLAFVLGGQAEHELTNANNPLFGILLTTGEFTVAWIAAGVWFDAFQQDHPPALRAFMGRSLNAWLVGAPLSTLVRALVLGRADIPVAFLIVVFLVGGAMLLGWRLVFIGVWTKTYHETQRHEVHE